MKVKYIKENRYSLVKDKIYNAFMIKGRFPGKENIISVIDDFGEEYAYPKDWFEIVEITPEEERTAWFDAMVELDDAADKAGGYVVPSNLCDFDGYVISRFRKYCDSLGKKPGQLTSEELQEFYTLCSQFKKVRYIGESDSVCLIHGKIYGCIGEEHGEYRIIDEEGYDADEEIQGYLYPKNFFVEVD